MAFSLSGFKNIGHYLATGFKYVATGLEDVIKVANKGQAIEPEVSALAAALAGPIGSQISDLAFHALGSVAAAITPVEGDAASESQAQTLAAQLQLAPQTVLDIKAATAQIEQLLAAVKAQKPGK